MTTNTWKLGGTRDSRARWRERRGPGRGGRRERREPEWGELEGVARRGRATLTPASIARAHRRPQVAPSPNRRESHPFSPCVHALRRMCNTSARSPERLLGAAPVVDVSPLSDADTSRIALLVPSSGRRVAFSTAEWLGGQQPKRSGRHRVFPMAVRRPVRPRHSLDTGAAGHPRSALVRIHVVDTPASVRDMTVSRVRRLPAQEIPRGRSCSADHRTSAPGR